MKLYCLPGACSLAPHIIICEMNLPIEIALAKKGTPVWDEVKSINPMGQVPLLITKEGFALAEGPAIMQYLVDSHPMGKELFPQTGESRYRAFEWMNFITSELHKGFSPLFAPTAFCMDPAHSESVKEACTERLKKALAVAEAKFGGPYCLGEKFSVADAYLFTVLSWSKFVKLSLEPFPKLSVFLNSLYSRPSVQRALKEEGLIK